MRAPGAPSRLPLLWAVPLAVVFAVLSVVADGVLSLYLIFLLVLTLRLVILLLRGRTEAGPDGLRNRLFSGTSTVAWADVDDLVIVPGLFGRYVRVGREDGRPVTLAAPREGLLARHTGLDEAMAAMRAVAEEAGTSLPPIRTVPPRGARIFLVALLVLSAVAAGALSAPWLDPWWPTRHEATKLPRACDLVDTGTRDRLTPGWTSPHASDTGGDLSVTSDCTLRGSGTSLELQTALERRSGYRSGTRVAAREFVVDNPRPPAVPVAGLGDEASRTTSVYQGVTMTRLLVRRGNVLVAVDYSAKRPAAELAAESDAVARTVLSRIPTSH